jgi:hypothetical protein
MRTAFTDVPDFAPYKALPNDVRLNEINQSHAGNSTRRAWELASGKMFSAWPPPVPDTDQKFLNHAIWYAIRISAAPIRATIACFCPRNCPAMPARTMTELFSGGLKPHQPLREELL